MIYSIRFFKNQSCIWFGVLTLLTSCNPRISGYISSDTPRVYNIKPILHLGPELKESSGLCHFDSKFWTINDGGGENLIYSFGIRKKDSSSNFRIENAVNHDWESLDDDSLFVYIADVGDNFGTRDSIFVYRILKTDITGILQIPCDIIRLSIPEKQVNPKSSSWSSHDCEAIALIDDSIYLFTKNWIDFTTSVYVIPAVPGSYSPSVRSVARVNMLVTGADFDSCSGKLYLIGYMKYKPVIIVFPSSYSGYLADKPFTRIRFPARFGTQTEAISVSCRGEVFITSERSIYPARLFKVSSKE